MSHRNLAPATKELKAAASKCFTIAVKEHGFGLLENLNRARLEERYCDFKIRVGQKIIKANKMILSEGSEYFHNMLSSPMKESSKGEVDISDVDFESLKSCVEYIYLGKITVMEENLLSLLVVAHRLQLRGLYLEVAKKVGLSLSTETYFAANRLASLFELPQLEQECNGFALENLHRIALEEDFVKIDSKCLNFLMTAKVTPVVKCKIFLNWANYDPESRRKEFEEFFLNLDLDDPSYISFLKENEPLFYNSNRCLKKVTLRDFTPCQDIDLESEFRESKNFSTITVGEDIFVFACDKRSWKLRYTEKNAKWCCLPSRAITDELEVVEVDGLIYAFDEAHMDSKAVEVYDGSKWSHVTDKPHNQSGSCIVAVDNSIYLMGGESDIESSSLCNKYETKKNCWTSLPPMPGQRTCGSAAELHRKIYVIGGHDEWLDILSTCLAYDVETKVWTKAARMSNPRYFFRAVRVNEKIFAICGVGSGNTIEEFDPSTNKWNTVMTLSENIVTTASVAL